MPSRFISISFVGLLYLMFFMLFSLYFSVPKPGYGLQLKAATLPVSGAYGGPLDYVSNTSLLFFPSINEPAHLITLNAPIATKVICFSRLLKCLRGLYGKQCGPRLDCEQSVLGPHCLLLYLIRQ